MDNIYNNIKLDLENTFNVIVHKRKRTLFDHIIIYIKPNYEGKIVSYIFSKYKNYLKLRVKSNNKLIYTYIVSDKNKISNIQKKLKKDKFRFKWLYEQIKDEEMFLKNVKEIK